MSDATQETWSRLWKLTGAPEPPGWYQRLVAAYSEPNRHYHNLRHIEHCLKEFKAARHLAANPVAVELALWFHDAIYDPHRHDNEELSGVLARQCLSAAGLDAPFGQIVSDLIRATRHEMAPPPGDLALMCDVDLTILGQSDNRFAGFEDEVRREYEWVPQPVFAAGRAEILQRFLRRDRIYTTDWFFDRYEAGARVNLQAAISKLLTGQAKA